MAKRITKHPRLVDRDYDILDHLRRYRLTTREVLHRLFFADCEPNAVTKVTSRLVDHGFLNRYELYTGRSYYVIGPESAKLLGISLKKCKPLGTQALPREYGILLFCCMTPTPRERLLVSDSTSGCRVSPASGPIAATTTSTTTVRRCAWRTCAWTRADRPIMSFVNVAMTWKSNRIPLRFASSSNKAVI